MAKTEIELINGKRLNDTAARAAAEKNAKAIEELKNSQGSGGNVKLPVDESGDPIYGTAGQYAVSDGAGGIKWVETAPDTGGDSGGDDSGGDSGVKTETEALTILWNHSADRTTFETNTSATNYALAEVSTIKANKLNFAWNAEECNGFQVMILQYDADGNPYKLSDVSSYSSAPTTDGADISAWADPGGGKYTALGGGDITVDLPTIGAVKVILRKSSATGTVATDHGTFSTWLSNGGLTITAIYEAETTAEAETLSMDDDYAMDYGVSTLALVTDEAANSDTGIDSTYAAVVEEAKNAWLLECNGDMDKIPLIIHTDQHGSINGNTALFSFLDEILNWYDVGKVINLGDTVSFWTDSDVDHKWNACEGLDNYLEGTKKIPWSKRIEVFGNHDTWTTSYETAENQAYLYKYFRNIYARRADNYGNFVVKDGNYNIKYVVVSGFAYDSELGGYTHYVVHPDAIRWVISELEKADGYDVIILSHCPLYDGTATGKNPITGEATSATLQGISYKKLTELWTGRKDKTSGSVTDEYGTSYDFDFTGCDGELLCGLHGHIHDDGYFYIGNLPSVYFDGYLNNHAVHFVIVDRSNRQLNVWKVDNTPQCQNYQISLDKPTE